MASAYPRKGSPYWHIKYQDETGKWKNKKTAYRLDNYGDKRQAELLARRQTEVEQRRRDERRSAEPFANWVEQWIHITFDPSQKQGNGSTATLLRRAMRTWGRFAKKTKTDLGSAAMFRYHHSQDYLEWRTSEDGNAAHRNTAIFEIRLMSTVLNESVRREHIIANPFARLGLKRSKPKEKALWSDEKYLKALHHFRVNGPEKFYVTWLLGLFQASRLRAANLPLSALDFPDRMIYWPSERMKGGKTFAQPMDERIVEPLQELAERRAREGHDTLCEPIGPLDSVAIRRHLDSIGLFGVSHHGLRNTWITRAAKSRKVTVTEAKQFANHASTKVHEVYQRFRADDVAHVPAEMPLPKLP